jgi:type III restriction enzyme
VFPKVLPIVKQWLKECLYCKDNTFPQLLLIAKFSHDAADKIHNAIVRSAEGEKRLKPLLRAYDQEGSTRYVDFDTTRPVYATRADKCHISHVVADTESWEQKLAQSLEDMDEVQSYVKNQNLGFTIPYLLNGDEKQYFPDFIVRIDDGHGKGDMLNLIIEVTGERKREKVIKIEAAKTLWVPAINNHGGFGRWAFLEITDPWDAKNMIKAFIEKRTECK